MAGKKKDERPKEPVPPPQVPPQSFDWFDPGTWGDDYKYAPAYVAIFAILVTFGAFAYFSNAVGVDMSTMETCVESFNYTFRINAVSSQADEYSKHSWEIGTAHEATMLIYTPQRSIFGLDPFPNGKLPKLSWRLDEASLYAHKEVKVMEDSLFDEPNGTVSGPATLGVAALMMAQGRSGYLEAATRQKEILLERAPRHENGAISDRFEHVEIRAEAVGRFAPFLAYYGVATNDLEMIREAVRQCRLYRDILRITQGASKGLWKHVAGPSPDDGAWSSGNAWAAYGMAKVSATIAAWPSSNATLANEKQELDSWIKEILDGAIRNDDSNLLRNYLDDQSSEGETSGTALLAATAYRMALLRPNLFPEDEYLDWANRKRREVFRRVDEDGFPTPVANPYDSKSRMRVTSPEGESFLLLLGTAWRDCVCRGPCLASYVGEVEQGPPPKVSWKELFDIPWDTMYENIKKEL